MRTNGSVLQKPSPRRTVKPWFQVNLERDSKNTTLYSTAYAVEECTRNLRLPVLSKGCLNRMVTYRDSDNFTTSQVSNRHHKLDWLCRCHVVAYANWYSIQYFSCTFTQNRSGRLQLHFGGLGPCTLQIKLCDQMFRIGAPKFTSSLDWGTG